MTLKDLKNILKIVLPIWFAFGLLVGAICTAEARIGGYTYVANKDGGLDRKNIGGDKTGCVYQSVAAFINPGYIIACELGRRRFEKEGFFR